MEYDALNRIERFAVDFLPHYLELEVPEFHRKWYDAFDDPDQKRVCIEAMRGGAKSTACKIACLQWICEGDQPEYHLITRSGGSTGLSTKWMKDIRNELEHNQVLKLTYGIERGDSWGNEHIQVIRGDGHKVDFYCRGKHGSIRGSRGNIIIDDPQNSADCRSETVLEADEEWFFSDVIPVLLQNQRLIFIATPISPLSLSSKVKRLDNFKTYSFPAEEPPGSGKSVWPEQYPDEFLADRMTEMGVDRYNAEYLCRPMVQGNPVFRPEWCQHYEYNSASFEKMKKDGLFVVTAIDPAISQKESADYTAIVTVGVTSDKIPDYYILDARRAHWTMKQSTEQLFIVFDKFQQSKTIVETVAYQKAIIEEITERQDKYHTYINPYEVVPDKDKVRRAYSIQALFQEGRVYFDKTDKGQQQLIDELVFFTGTGAFHDDLVDALVYALSDLRDFTYRGTQEYQNQGFGSGVYGNG